MNEELHDEVARVVAATRFPFKGQADWPADYVTHVNAGAPKRAIPTPDGPLYPDIVVVDGNDRVREIGEVELAVDEGCAARWRRGSAAADDDTDSGARHFFVYVPAGLEEAAKRVLDAHGISYAGVRGWRADGGFIEVLPFITTGEAKDHVATRSA